MHPKPLKYQENRNFFFLQVLKVISVTLNNYPKLEASGWTRYFNLVLRAFVPLTITRKKTADEKMNAIGTSLKGNFF